MSVVDDLILKYSLVDDYSAKAKKIKQSADDLKSSLKDVGDAAGKFGSDLETDFKQALGAVTALGAAIIGVGAFSVRAYIQYDTIKRSIIGLSGSAEQGAKNMKTLNDLVLKTGFERMQLAPVAQTLAAFNADIEKFLPLAAEVGEAFGNDAGKAGEFAEMIGRIKSGDFGRPFGPEGLGRFGITHAELEAQGLVFDKSKAYKGSVEDALNAVAAIVHEKFDGVAKTIAGSPQAKLTNFFDKLNDGAIRLGASIASKVLPHFDKIMKFLDDVIGSGVLEKIVKSFLDLFGVSGKDLNDTLYSLKQFIMRLPETIEKAKPYIQELGKAIKFLADHWKLLLVAFAAIKIGTLVADIVKLGIAVWNFGKGAIALIRGIAQVVSALGGGSAASGAAGTAVGAADAGAGIGIGAAATAAAPWVAIAAGIATVGYEIYSIIKDLRFANTTYQDVAKPILTPDDFKKMRERAQQRDQAKKQHALDAAEQARKKAADVEAAKLARQRQTALDLVVANTAKIAQNTKTSLDLQQFAGGGGNIAKFAYTPVDASNYRHGRSAEHAQMLKSLASSKANGIESFITGVIHEAIAQSVREGYLVPA